MEESILTLTKRHKLNRIKPKKQAPIAKTKQVPGQKKLFQAMPTRIDKLKRNMDDVEESFARRMKEIQNSKDE